MSVLYNKDSYKSTTKYTLYAFYWVAWYICHIVKDPLKSMGWPAAGADLSA